MSYTVEDAIVAIENEYRVRFSYSKQIVPYQEVVHLDLSAQSLPSVLESLTDQTGIVYQRRGKRVALSYDPTIREEASMTSIDEAEKQVEIPRDLKGEVSQSMHVIDELPTADTYEGLGGEVVMEEGIYFEQSKSLIGARPSYDPVAMLESLREKDPRILSIYQDKKQVLESELTEPKVQQNEEEDIHLAQVSLLPVGFGQTRKLERKYHVSFNAIAGRTGSVEGLEFGVLHNHITNHLEGVQISGFSNRVDGDAQGGQIAGFSNRGGGIFRGIQLAGVANTAHQADAMQVAGLYNHNREVSRGLQAAGLFNISRNIAGSQMAGLFNSSSGSNNLQVAGFLNMAGQTHVQMSGFVNVAREVKWLQLGIINVADTVGGASIGLLNLIKRGYNKVEFSTSESLFANLAIKLGTKGFYNIFQVSTNFKRNLTGNGLVWGYGYGFGFFIPLAAKLRLNPEVLVMNIHERNFLQPDLNLLNQGKLLFNFKRKNLEFFVGPTFNLSISKVRSQDASIIGTSIAPYSIWESTYFRSFNSINTKFWIGFNAGIRI